MSAERQPRADTAHRQKRRLLAQRITRQHEPDLHAALHQATRQPLAGLAQTAGKQRRVFPAEHEDPWTSCTKHTSSLNPDKLQAPDCTQITVAQAPAALPW